MRPSSRRLTLVVMSAVSVGLVAVGILAPLVSSAIARATAQDRVIAWNNLGMHCMDDDFAVFSLLPPYNTLHAQIVRSGSLVTDPTSYSVTYKGVADATGSINTTSSSKTNFWQNVLALFGANVSAEQGLAGNPMPGAANDEHPMTWDASLNAFVAEGIPITPYDDTSKKNFYPMFRVIARQSAVTLATTDVVLPVSDEMTCTACHESGSPDAAKPAGGWVFDADPKRDYRLNILRLHDEKNASDPAYATSLSTLGFLPAGLEATATQQGPILCAACHLSNALPGSGQAGLKPLTEALHAHHAAVVDFESGMTLDAIGNRTACYQCHPGSVTKCLRGAMGAAVASDGTLAMQCQSCHGNMSAVGAPGRVGWLDEPSCQECHTGTAVDNAGKIRFLSAFDAQGNPHVPANDIFATNPNVPAPGFDLYRFSKGHGGLQCEACHGSTHAEFPSTHANDNAQSIAMQGHKGTLAECSTCHGDQLLSASGGPHGMHPVGQAWVFQHGEVAEGDDLAAGANECRACHGVDYRGTVLSRAFSDRTLATDDFGTKKLWRGFQVGCYACHNGPSSENKNPNHPPVVKDAAIGTDDATPITVQLKATDSDGDALELRIVSQPTHGTVGLQGKQATYFPEPGFAGVETFTFAAWDGDIDSNLGKVVVTTETVTCPATLATDTSTFDVTGGSDAIALTLAADCPWTATITDPAATWLTLTGPTAGTGNAIVPFAVAPNSGVARSATVLIATASFVVRQAGSDSADLVGAFKKVTAKPNTAGTKTRFEISLRVTNLGGGKAKKSRVDFYLSEDAAFGPSDSLLTSMDVSALESGESVKLLAKASVAPASAASGKFVIAKLDAGANVVEYDETDNIVVHGPLQ